MRISDWSSDVCSSDLKASVSAGADLIIALNAGLYRNMGFGSLAAFMPYGNANEQTEELLKTHILAHSGSTPVVAGVFSADPSMSLRTRLERLQNLGVEIGRASCRERVCQSV